MFNDYVDNLETIPPTTRSQRKVEGDLVVRLLQFTYCRHSLTVSHSRFPHMVTAPELVL